MKKEFDKYIDGYRSNCDKSLRLSGETSTFFAKYKAQKLAEWLPSKALSAGNILDFGCGDGTMTNFVKKFFAKAKMFGVDPSPKSIEEARSDFGGIDFSVNSDEHTQLNFQSNFFDLIFSAGVFHHIPFSKHDEYLKELARLLKPGGHFVLFELNPLNPLTVFTFKRNPIDKYANLMWPSYSKRLTKKLGPTEAKYYCFYPKILSWLRPTEPYLTKVPFGALYAIITQKEGELA